MSLRDRPAIDFIDFAVNLGHESCRLICHLSCESIYRAPCASNRRRTD